jgi:hypothetical protein
MIFSVKVGVFPWAVVQDKYIGSAIAQFCDILF